MDEPKEASVASGATLWQGRFDAGPSPTLMALSASLAFDKELWFWDIAGSRAHVKMLGRQGILSEDDVRLIVDALDRVEQEMSSGDFVFLDTDEDIHTAIERRVTQIAGEAGARLHTGRSRNDQVATALRLWSRHQIDQIVDLTCGLVEALERRAHEADGDEPAVYLPGYTHMQQAQPVLLSHHLRAHCFALLRDVERLLEARARVNVSPLGAGALAGSSLDLDPQWTAAALGFDAAFSNSLDAVSDRDFVAEILFDVALLGVHLSRMGEEWVLWTSTEFGFASLDDSVATGSSMLPQKKNADIAELTRGKSGRLVGNLTGLMVTLKGLPLAYNRDLQEDKEPIFDSVRQIRLVLAAMTEMVEKTVFNVERMVSAASSEFIGATDLAEWLVERGVPFREAHSLVGGLVRESLSSGMQLSKLVEGHPRLGPDAARLLAPGRAVERRKSPGSSGPAAVAGQRSILAGKLDDARRRSK